MDVAIVGAAETERIGVVPDRSALGLHLEGARNALADCGLRPSDVDGIASVADPGPVQVAHALGIAPQWIDGTGAGGTSFLLHVRHAVAAVRSGAAHTVLITHGESGRSRIGAHRRGFGPASMQGQFEVPYGIMGPPTMFTIPLLRYMKRYGLTHEQLAMVSVTTRAWAGRNPRAMYRDPITVEDVLASRLIAYPLHLLECCLVTDGGGALVVTSAERARDLPKPPVYVLGGGESAESPIISQMADFTTSAAFRRSSAAAFAEARLTPDDVDHVMIYDAFAHVPIYGLEDMGFCKPGEAGGFIADGNTAPGGPLPLNTNGGGLSYTHTGMYGMFLLQESVRQLRGEAAAQVDGVEVSMALGNGGMFMSSGALLLGRQPR
jgi:acetyl-CoA acetyltransferase